MTKFLLPWNHPPSTGPLFINLTHCREDICGIVIAYVFKLVSGSEDMVATNIYGYSFYNEYKKLCQFSSMKNAIAACDEECIRRGYMLITEEQAKKVNVLL